MLELLHCLREVRVLSLLSRGAKAVIVMVALGRILLAGITMVLERSVLNGLLLAVCDMSGLMALISTLTGLGTSLCTGVYVQYFKNNFYIS